jgi:hypothetical protein
MNLSEVAIGSPCTIYYPSDYYAAKVVAVKGKRVTVAETGTLLQKQWTFSLRKNGRLVLKGMTDRGIGLRIGTAEQYIHND